MEKEKFEDFFNSIGNAFENVGNLMAGIKFSKIDTVDAYEDKVSIVIGMVGNNKGRILLETSAETAVKIAEGINMDPVGSDREMYLFLAEFTNTFSGNSVTTINNKYRGTGLRLTPPAVFAGVGMEVTTPNVQSATACFKCEYGTVMLDIGFEGR